MSDVKGSIDDWQKLGTLGKGTFGRVSLWKHKVCGIVLQVCLFNVLDIYCTGKVQSHHLERSWLLCFLHNSHADMLASIIIYF